MYKSFRVLACCMCLLFGQALAQENVFKDGEFRPYDDLPITAGPVYRATKERVIFFADFTCPYCRHSHGYLRQWAEMLPEPYRFEVVPAVANDEQIAMAIGYYVVLQIAPRKAKELEGAMYAALQDRGSGTTNRETYISIARQLGIEEEEFLRVTESDSTKGYVSRAHQLTEKFGIEEVPTLVVAGRYRTGPSRVHNDQQSFLALLNGLISQDYLARQRR